MLASPGGTVGGPRPLEEQASHDRFPSYHLYQLLPDAELMLLPDSGHGAHFQYVERFVRRVIDFLDVQPHDTATPA